MSAATIFPDLRELMQVHCFGENQFGRLQVPAAFGFDNMLSARPHYHAHHPNQSDMPQPERVLQHQELERESSLISMPQLHIPMNHEEEGVPICHGAQKGSHAR